MNKCIKKYCLKYVVRNAVLIFGFAAFISLLFLIVGKIYGTLDKYYGYVFAPLVFAIFIFLFTNVFLTNFCNMIKEQERTYGVTFNDKNAEKLCELIYLTDEWLIDSGTKAILRKNIKSIDFYRVYSQRGSVIRVRIHTKNKVYETCVFTEKHVMKLQLWCSCYEDNWQFVGD